MKTNDEEKAKKQGILIKTAGEQAPDERVESWLGDRIGRVETRLGNEIEKVETRLVREIKEVEDDLEKLESIAYNLILGVAIPIAILVLLAATKWSWDYLGFSKKFREEKHGLRQSELGLGKSAK